MRIRVHENLYDAAILAAISADATLQLAASAKINKVGNKFAQSTVTDIIVKPFESYQCNHWYVAYFQHIRAVYPHTDNDASNMDVIGIIPLHWETADLPHTYIHNETSETKEILKTKDTVTMAMDFKWAANSAVLFDANLFHSSSEFNGIKTGIQLIGYRFKQTS